LLVIFLLFLGGLAHAQQPFLTDDADVAKTKQFHFEMLAEHDLLQHTSYPAVRQHTTRAQITYGVSDRLEIGADAPLLAIFNARSSGFPTAVGVGDLDLQMKYTVRPARDGSAWPAVALAFAVEVPTGNPRNSLGSGLADYWLNVIGQKSLTSRVTWRANTGILFSGNTLTGALGIKSVHGVVFTGASSLTYQATARWLVGTEVAGAMTQQFDLGKGQLQFQLGAKYALRKSLTLDLALTGGKFEGSPRIGGAVGFSVDF